LNILKSALMENFRGYGKDNNLIQFSPGVNLILGDNATGKSSIVTLILFDLLHKKIDVGAFEEYRTLEPRDTERFRAALTIIGVDGKDYTIEKLWPSRPPLKINVKQDGTEMKKAGELELARKDDAQRFILEKFGATAEILEEILVQVQDPVKLLWPVSDPRRVGAALSRLLRYEPLQHVFTNAQSARRMLSQRANDFELNRREIEQQIQDLGLLSPAEYEKQEKKFTKNRDRLVNRLKDAETEISRLKGQKSASEKQLRILNQKQGKLSTLLEQIDKGRRELRGKRKPKESAENLEAQKTEAVTSLKEIRNQLRKLEGDIGSVKTNKSEADKEIEKFQTKIDGLSARYSELSKAAKAMGLEVELKDAKEAQKLRKEKDKECRKLAGDIGGLEEETKAEGQYVEILSKAEATCPVCDAKLTKQKREQIVEQKTERIQELKEKARQMHKSESEVATLINTLEELETVLKGAADFTDRLTEAQKKSKGAERWLPKLLRTQATLGKKEKLLEEKQDGLQTKIEVAKTFQDIDEWQLKARSVKKELVAVPRLEKQRSALDRNMERFNEQRMVLAGRIERVSTELENAGEKRTYAQARYGELAEAMRRVEVCRDFADEMQLAAEAAKVSLHELFVGYRDMINNSLSWIWPTLYPRSDLREIKLQVQIEEAEERGESTLVTEIQLTRTGVGGEAIPFNTISSHGQRVLASIAFRVAFLSLLWRTNVPRILVLDEPTIWIDNRNRERLGQLLANLAKEVKGGGIKLDQVIVVSHDPAFLNAIDPEGVKHVCIKNHQGFCEVGMTEIE